MKRAELLGFLDGAEQWDYYEPDDGGLVVFWWQGPPEGEPVTQTLVSDEAIKRHDLATILKACKQGRDVQQITRVTGYFSTVGRWNKGKQAELKDRHRTPLGRKNP